MSRVIPIVSPEQVFERKSQGDVVHLIDVRTPGEFSALHADGAKLCPLERFDSEAIDSSLGLDQQRAGITEPLYLVCRSGTRATQAAEKLMGRGYQNVYVVDGGTDRWVASGLPVVRGKSVMSIERQVQIAVGMLVILKVIFGFAVSPVFFLLVALLGGGLVFAGLTQNCAMAKFIARMPWNQVQSCLRPSNPLSQPKFGGCVRGVITITDGVIFSLRLKHITTSADESYSKCTSAVGLRKPLLSWHRAVDNRCTDHLQTGIGWSGYTFSPSNSTNHASEVSSCA